MTCTFANPITEDEISDLLDGDMQPHLMQHLQNCPDCSQRLLAAQRIENSLADALFRFDCPSADELADYHYGFLDNQRKNQVTEHLKLCTSCRSELQVFNTGLDSRDSEDIQPMPANVITPPDNYFVARVTIQQLKKARGYDKHIRAQVEGLQILLDIQLSSVGYAIEGMLVPTDNKDDQWQKSSVEVRIDNQTEALTFSDELGTFHFDITKKGQVTILLVSGSSKVVEISDLNILPEE